MITVQDSQALEIIDIFDHDTAFGTADHGPSVGNAYHGNRQLGDPAAAVAQRDALLLIHMQSGISTVGIDPADIVSEDHGSKIQQIDPYVQQGASAQIRIQHPSDPSHIVAETCRQHDRFSNDPGPQGLQDLARKRQETDPHGLRGKYMFLMGQGQQFLRHGGVQAERLLAEDRPAILDAHFDLLIMLRMRGRDVDQVHLAVLQKLLQGTVRLFETVFLGEFIGPVRTSGTDRVGPDLRNVTNGLRHLPRHIAGPDDRHI